MEASLDQMRPLRLRHLGRVEADRIVREATGALCHAFLYARRNLPPAPPGSVGRFIAGILARILLSTRLGGSIPARILFSNRLDNKILARILLSSRSEDKFLAAPRRQRRPAGSGEELGGRWASFAASHRMKKLAIITSHPIQYNAPWFRHLAAQPGIDLKVFYLWDFGVTGRVDPGFEHAVTWDIPLLDGYAHELVANVSARPGTSHFLGLQNPSLTARVKAFGPAAVLMMTYNYASTHRFLWSWRASPLIFRGDSHELVPRVGLKQLARRAGLTLLMRRFAAFLYVGQANRRYFLRHGVPAERLFFAPHAVDNARFMGDSAATRAAAMAWRRELGIPEAEAVVLSAGKFEPKKRLGDLIRAFLAADLPGAGLLLVGSGPGEGELRALAAGHPRIRFAPFQNQLQMPRTYAAADLFVLASQGPSETWGLVVNEAMCLARPILVSDHVGCAEDLVEPGQNGVVFPSGQIPALTRCLADALKDRARLRNWGERSFAIVSRYSYAQTTEGLQEALLHLDAERARGPR